MHVYHEYFGADKVALVYPGEADKCNIGRYSPKSETDLSEKECSVIIVSTKNLIIDWQKNICKNLNTWINSQGTNNRPC